jgi:hypothetical protein
VGVLQYFPLIEILFVTLPVLMYVNAKPNFNVKRDSSLFEGLERQLELKRKDPFLEQPSNNAGKAAVSSKRATPQDRGSIAQFEKNLFNQLYIQIEQANHESINITSSTTTGIERYFITVDHIVKAIENPYSKQGLKVFCWPVLSIPQRKRHLFSCEPGIPLTADYGFIRLNDLESKPSRGLIGVINFLVFLRTISMIRENLSSVPRVPFVVDIPSCVFDYPKLVHYFFEYIDHAEFPIKQIIWRMSEMDYEAQSAGLVERIYELGGDIICVLNEPRIENNFSILQINADKLEQLVQSHSHKQNQEVMAQFADQTSQIILGNVASQTRIVEDFGSSFDYVWGSAFEAPQTIENLTISQNLFNSHHGEMKIA